MAKEATKEYRKDVLVKWHRKANMWCKTSWDVNGQHTTFHDSNPTERCLCGQLPCPICKGTLPK